MINDFIQCWGVCNMDREDAEIQCVMLLLCTRLAYEGCV